MIKSIDQRLPVLLASPIAIASTPSSCTCNLLLESIFELVTWRALLNSLGRLRFVVLLAFGSEHSGNVAQAFQRIGATIVIVDRYAQERKIGLATRKRRAALGAK